MTPTNLENKLGKQLTGNAARNAFEGNFFKFSDQSVTHHKNISSKQDLSNEERRKGRFLIKFIC